MIISEYIFVLAIALTAFIFFGIGFWFAAAGLTRSLKRESDKIIKRGVWTYEDRAYRLRFIDDEKVDHGDRV